MPAVEPGKIRNVAVVGHRGTGKTSLVEAMLFQAGATNRLGVVEQGTTISDWDEDEQEREMSISDSLTHLEWHERKINLIDTPGEPSFQGDAIAALHVVEGALVVVSGVMGVEVQTSRNWQRAEDLGLARVVFVNMLDRERADFYRTLEQLRSQFGNQCVAIHLPIGAEHEMTGIVDLLHMTAYTSPEGAKEGSPTEIPADLADQVEQYRTQMLDSVSRQTRRSWSATSTARSSRPKRSQRRSRLPSPAASSSRSPVGSRRRTSAPRRCSTCSSRASRPRRRRARRSR